MLAELRSTIQTKAMTECDALSALLPGAPLWVIPALEQSTWGPRIDWYLGFQIRRALPHRRFEFSDSMRQLMEAYEEKIPKVGRTEDSPLMIASANLLPNHQTVLVPQRDSVEWVKSCHKVWVGMGRPTARIFLPKSIPKAFFEKTWPRADLSANIQVVVST